MQLRRHLQCRACILKPPAPGASGKFTNSEKLPSPWSGYGSREIPDLWSAPVQGITISESSQLSSVSQLGCSHPLAHYVCKLRSCNLEIAQTYCAIPRLRKRIAQSQDWLCNLEIGTQFRDSENAQRNLEIAQIPRLCGT